MKVFRFLSVLLILVLFGGAVGYFLSQWGAEEGTEGVAEERRQHLLSGSAVKRDFSVGSGDYAKVDVRDFPPTTIPGEYVLHFSNREDYLAYLRALSAEGLSAIGQIDRLRVVRVGQDVMARINPERYGAEPDFSYRVEQPLPPAEMDPEALARLQAFGITAREIVGGSVDGDGAGILVGILDSGIEVHSTFDDVYIVDIDLAGAGVAGPGAGHGTAVASIIAGRDGIAPAAELFVVRVLDENGSGNSFHVADGIIQATDMGVHIINMSLGVYQDSRLLREAVQYATEQGVLIVAAAGNDGYMRLPYPAGYSGVLSVTAVDQQGRQALFPNQSMQIDFAAPGVGVVAAAAEGGTQSFSGTSAAAPFVSGTLAAMLSADPGRTSRQTVELLKRYLNDAGAPGVDPVYGAGVVDWDRLRERATPGILDAAVASIHLDPAALPGTTMPIEVTVQNRGTRWFSGADLEVIIGEADPVNFLLESLGPGQTTTRRVFAQIPSMDSDEALTIAARVLPEKPMDDVRLENNLKVIQFRPRDSE